MERPRSHRAVSRSPTELPNKLFLLSMASYFTLLLIHRFSKSAKVVFKAALPGGSTCLLKIGVSSWEDSRVHQGLALYKWDKFYSHSRSFAPSSRFLGFHQHPMLHSQLLFKYYPRSLWILKCQRWKNLRDKLNQDPNFIDGQKWPRDVQ